MKWDYITIVEISGQDHLPCDSIEKALHQYASSQAFFNTLEVVFWKYSPKISDLTGYSVFLLLFAASLFFLHLPCFSDKHSSSVPSSDPPQERLTIILLPPTWICRATFKMHIAECFCLPVICSFSQDSLFSSCQPLAAIVPLFYSSHVSQLVWSIVNSISLACRSLWYAF